ncbi:MAG: hypothetical protein R3F61_20800 [Myxococcota bacterium]
MIWLITVLSASAAPPRAALATTAIMPKTLFKPGDPVMIHLAMENRTDRTLWFEQHSTAACFMQKFADVEANPPITMKPIDGECTAPSSKVKPGEKVSRTLDLHEVYDFPEQSYTFLTIKWKDGGPDIYGPTSQRIGPINYKTPIFEGRMKKGDDLFLPNKTALVWNGHESKPPVRPGEPSPLELDFLLRIPGTGETPRKVSLQVEKSRQFQLDGYTVELGDYQLDQWMDVRIYPK